MNLTTSCTMASLYLVRGILMLTLVLNIHILKSSCESIIRDSEKIALLKLEQDWGKPVALNWSSITNTDHCDWSGVICTDGFVTGLSLAGHNIHKPIPKAICSFKNLFYIDLSNNQISGSFRTSIFNCSRLQHLDLSFNSLFGFLSANIHKLLPKLSYLNLASNSLSGSIPSTICQLHGLRFLHLGNNYFNESYPAELGNLSELRVLSLAHNPFAPGRMHPQFGNLSNIKYLWMSNMNIVGEIPDTLSQLSQLRLLDLSSNRLNGMIPSGVWRLRSMEMLYLDNNSLYGHISGPIEAMSLTEINVSNNVLTGWIPEDFGKLKNLTRLLLHDNHISGFIPKGIALLPMLHDMQLSRNFLSGGLPNELGKHSMLFNIEISSNNLSGKLPEGLCSFQALQYIDFSNNRLSGELPKSILHCRRLRSIFLNNNQFRGSFPGSIWSLPDLNMIMIQENGFSGSLPSKLSSSITTINISNNRFSGSLPMSAENLNTLIAENNFISGEVPTNLILHAPLEVLILAGNTLSGLLPSSIWYMWFLKELDLRKNNLSGEIPNILPDTSTMHLSMTVDTIDLSENNLSGPIPEILIYLRPIHLNLSNNQLTGQIPPDFEINDFQQSFVSNPGLCSSDNFGNYPMCIRQPGLEERGKHLKRPIIIFLILSSTIFVFTGIFCFIKIRAFLTRQKHGAPSPRWKLTTFHPINYNVEDILCGLTNTNIVGSGGSGKVYKICLGNNCKIAVKKIGNGLKKDDMLEKQFQAEIETLGSIRHANIVKLLGFISASESKLLIYEYMEHGSLYDWLHQGDLTTEQLNWPMRMSIAIDAARGLSYMHHDLSPPIAHRDVKSSNILLDLEFKAKIADFGLARALVKAGEPESVSAMVGSFGYMAPEFASIRKINEKVDVYSFGVVLLELTTGRRATGENGSHENLAQWAWRQFQEESFQMMDVIDENIRDASNFREVQLVFKLGLICTGPKPSLRPTMKEVLQVLHR